MYAYSWVSVSLFIVLLFVVRLLFQESALAGHAMDAVNDIAIDLDQQSTVGNFDGPRRQISRTIGLIDSLCAAPCLHTLGKP